MGAMQDRLTVISPCVICVPWPQIKSSFSLISGDAISHSLGSPVLAFIQPLMKNVSYNYAVVSSSKTTFTPRVLSDCRSGIPVHTAPSSCLLISYGQPSFFPRYCPHQVGGEIIIVIVLENTNTLESSVQRFRINIMFNI